jgi:hypothetical protein
MEPATDLEILIKKGFPEDEAKKALLETRGNLKAAVVYLTRGDTGSRSWGQETAHEWVDNVSSTDLLTSTGRAIRKSTYHLRLLLFFSLCSPSLRSVQRWDRQDNHVFYTINVIMRDGRQWKLKKRYSAIHEFWRSMPIGSTKHFRRAFPQPIIWLGKADDDTFNDQRCLALDEWFSELSLDEKSMSDPRIVAHLDRFLETSEQPPAPVTFNSNSDLPSWVLIPDSNLTTFSVSLETLSSQLPCKVNLADLFPQRPVSKTEANVSLSITGSDVTVKQISKDLSRDRIIVQGRRFEGSESGFNGVLEATIAAAGTAIREAGGSVVESAGDITGPLTFSREVIAELCLTSLGQLGRTESAYASLSALTTVVDQASTPDLILVPESVLAHPLLVRFRVLKPESRGAATAPRPSPLLSNGPTKETTSPLTRAPAPSAGQQRQHVSPLTHHLQKRGSPLLATPPPAPSSSATDPHHPRHRHPPVSIFDQAPPPRLHQQAAQPVSATAPSSPSSAAGSGESGSNRAGAGAGGLVVDMQATTVYRFAHFETMQTVLQLRATFCQSIKLPLSASAALAPPSPLAEGQPEGDESRRKAIQRLFLLSKSFVIFDRDTRTSQRDWK